MGLDSGGASRLGFVKKAAAGPVLAAASAQDISLGHFNVTGLLGNVSSGVYTERLLISAATGVVTVSNALTTGAVTSSGSIVAAGQDIYIGTDIVGSSRLGFVKKTNAGPVIAAGSTHNILLGHYGTANLANNITTGTFTSRMSISAATGAVAIVNGVSAATVTIAGTDPLFSNMNWASWTPVSTDTNVVFTTSYARFAVLNKRAWIEFSFQMAFTASAATTAVTLPTGQTIPRTAKAVQAYTKATGFNTYVNTNSTQNSIQTVGTAVGDVSADSTTSKLILGLVNFIPGTWTVVGTLTYEIA